MMGYVLGAPRLVYGLCPTEGVSPAVPRPRPGVSRVERVPAPPAAPRVSKTKKKNEIGGCESRFAFWLFGRMFGRHVGR